MASPSVAHSPALQLLGALFYILKFLFLPGNFLSSFAMGFCFESGNTSASILFLVRSLTLTVCAFLLQRYLFSLKGFTVLCKIPLHSRSFRYLHKTCLLSPGAFKEASNSVAWLSSGFLLALNWAQFCDSFHIWFQFVVIGHTFFKHGVPIFIVASQHRKARGCFLSCDSFSSHCLGS